jgi:aminoglycoside phosphotransferase (APT) family kinase protein
VSEIDAAKAVRAGEELDRGSLLGFLKEPLAAAFGAPVTSIDIDQFPSGHSNLTYLLRATTEGGGDRELVLRRPPFGNVVKTAHDMGREFRILSRLSSRELVEPYDKAPEPLVYCDDVTVIGAPFYVMKRLRGVILRRKSVADPRLDPQTAAKLSDRFVDALVELHGLDWKKMGLGEFDKSEGFVERQVRGWAKRYADAKTDEVPEIERAAAWLVENLPESASATLIHNDFKYDNLVLDSDDLTRIVGVLDWEMSTIGDPLVDLGTALAYWVEATDPEPIKAFAFGPTHVPGSLTRKRIAELYGERTGRDLSKLVYYYVFALFKNAVVAQQIYARFKKGLTKDERFAMMIMGVRLLGEAAVRTIDTRSF